MVACRDYWCDQILDLLLKFLNDRRVTVWCPEVLDMEAALWRL